MPRRRVAQLAAAAVVIAAGLWIADWFGIHLEEWKAIGFVALILAGFAVMFVVLILAVMRFEERRNGRAMTALADALGGRLVEQPGPGRWRWTTLEAIRHGRAITLRTVARHSGRAGGIKTAWIGLELAVGDHRELFDIPRSASARAKLVARVDELGAASS